MPRLVDHSRKRREIVEATRRLIAEGGFDAASMREIAAAAGHANGALKHYFADKDELLRATYLFVWEATIERITARLGDRTGLDAVRVYWDEIAPASEVALQEARVVLPFFARAAVDPALAAITTDTIDRWRAELVVHIDQARVDGDITAGTPTAAIVEHLLTLLLGLQIAAPINHARRRTTAHQTLLTTFLDSLRT